MSEISVLVSGMPLSKCGLMVAVILLLRYRCVTPTVLKVFGGVAYVTAGLVLRVLWRAGVVDKKDGVWCLHNATKADVLRAIYMSCYKTRYMEGINRFCSLVNSVVGNGTVKLTFSKMLLPTGCSSLMSVVYRLVGRHINVIELKKICEQLKSVPYDEGDFHMYIDVVNTLKLFNNQRPETIPSDVPTSQVSNNDVEDFDTLPGRF